MAGHILTALLLLYALFALIKVAFFFVLSYPRRRRALDQAYRGRASATGRSDIALLVFAILLAVLLAVRGSEPVSFLAGLLIGMTLIQLYFHQFSRPLAADQEPPEPRSPIKWISYAIQAMPARPWKEMLVIALLLCWSAFEILKGR
jgi:hypothetical protein